MTKFAISMASVPTDTIPPATITHNNNPMKHLRPGKMLLAAAVKAAFDDAMEYKGKLSEQVLTIQGMSGKKYRYFINNLVEKLQSPRYLEVGSWAGSTLCSAIYKNAVTAVAIDDWSQFGGPIDQFFRNLAESCSVDTKVSVLSQDFRKVDFKALGKFNIYLFDGPHEAKDQYDGLSMALDCLEDEFVYIVDDWNWGRVREGTLASIADLGLTVMSSTEVRSTEDDNNPQVAFQESDWHNGYFIAILRK